MLKIEQDLINQGYKLEKIFTNAELSAKLLAKQKRKEGFLARVVQTSYLTHEVYIKDKNTTLDEEQNQKLKDERGKQRLKKEEKRNKEEQNKNNLIELLETYNLNYKDFEQIYNIFSRLTSNSKEEIKQYFNDK